MPSKPPFVNWLKINNGGKIKTDLREGKVLNFLKSHKKDGFLLQPSKKQWFK